MAHCLFVLFSDSDAEGEDLAQPEFRGLWEEGVHKVSFGFANMNTNIPRYPHINRLVGRPPDHAQQTVLFFSSCKCAVCTY